MSVQSKPGDVSHALSEAVKVASELIVYRLKTTISSELEWMSSRKLMIVLLVVLNFSLILAISVYFLIQQLLLAFFQGYVDGPFLEASVHILIILICLGALGLSVSVLVGNIRNGRARSALELNQ